MHLVGVRGSAYIEIPTEWCVGHHFERTAPTKRTWNARPDRGHATGMKDEHVSALNFVDWPLPENHLAELGRLSALWSILEGQLDVCLGKVAGFDELSDPRPFILLKHSSFPQKVDSLAALCEQLGPSCPHLAGYATTIGRLRSAQTLRNRFAHNGMAINPESGHVEMAVGSARGKLKTRVERVTLADIRRASMEVHCAMLDLHALVTGKVYPPRWERS